MIFSNPAFRAKLNSATHLPIIIEIFKQILWLRLVKLRPVVILDAPLLFETKLNYLCSKVIVVSCKPDVQVMRLTKRDACSREDAEKAIASQMPLAIKERRADIVVDNNGSVALLEAEARVVFARLRE
jgi:dephospho-CoA kinase